MAEAIENKSSSTDPKEQVEFLLKTISRYDFYINTTNTKASLILAWNGIITGSVFLKFDSILSLFSKPSWASTVAAALLLTLGLFSVISIILAYRVINPFLLSGTPPENQSLLFFGSVAQMPFSAYSEAIKGLSTEVLLADLTQQSHTLAQGLKDKMDETRKSICAIYGSLFCIILLLILKGITIYVAPL